MNGSMILFEFTGILWHNIIRQDRKQPKARLE